MATQEPKSDRCGAKTRNGGYCEKYPIEGRVRCRNHGGATPRGGENPNVGAPENNDFAKGNSGGPPELNTNARTANGAWSDWEKAYKRFDDETRAYVDRLIDSMREQVEAPDVSEDRREELLREYATLSVLEQRASFDVFATGSDSARGFVVTEEIEHNGEAHVIEKVNPALEASNQHSARQRVIANELDLWPHN